MDHMESTHLTWGGGDGTHKQVQKVHQSISWFHDEIQWHHNIITFDMWSPVKMKQQKKQNKGMIANCHKQYQSTFSCAKIFIYGLSTVLDYKVLGSYLFWNITSGVLWAIARSSGCITGSHPCLHPHFCSWLRETNLEVRHTLRMLTTLLPP